MKPTQIKVKTPGFIFHLSYVSDSPITHNIEAVLNERLKDTYIDSDIYGFTYGKHFFLDAKTINGRNYSDPLWHGIIDTEEFKRNLKLGKYYGMVGHDGRPINDDDARKNLITHKVNDMWIDGKVGYAICSLFGQNGKELAAQLANGIYLRPSTRGTLAYAGITNLTTENYKFLGIDYVTNPALPQVDIIFLKVESVEKNEDYVGPEVGANESVDDILIVNTDEENKENGDIEMAGNDELINEIRISRDQALQKCDELQNKIDQLTAENTDLKIQIGTLTTAIATKEAVETQLKTDFDNVSQAYQNRLGKYNELETTHAALESKYQELCKTMANESEETNTDKLIDLLKEGGAKVTPADEAEEPEQGAPAGDTTAETEEKIIDLYTEEQLKEAVKESGKPIEIGGRKAFQIELDETIKVEEGDSGEVKTLDPETTKFLIVFEDEPNTLYTD